MTSPGVGKCVNAKGRFIAVIDDAVFGIFEDLCSAKAVLNNSSEDEDEKIIFQVENGKVLRSASNLAGQPQTVNLDPEELEELYEKAVEFLDFRK